MARITVKVCSPNQFAAVGDVFAGHYQPATVAWTSAGPGDDPADVAYRDFTVRLTTKVNSEFKTQCDISSMGLHAES